MTDTTVYAAQGFLGRTEDGDRVWIRIEIRESDRTAQTVEHEWVDRPRELSISGSITYKGHRNASGGGQNIGDAAAAMHKPAKGLTEDDIADLVTVWKRWHLNGLKASCAHQTVVWEDRPYGRRPSLELTKPCPVQAEAAAEDEHAPKPYRYGTAWLVKPLPTDVEQWVHTFGEKLDGTQPRG